MQPMLLGQRIRALRERQGMSQVGLARALGASINAINMLEVGSTRAPHIDRLIAIADLFNVSIDYLVGRTDDPRPRRRREQSSDEDTESARDEEDTVDWAQLSPLEMHRELVRASIAAHVPLTTDVLTLHDQTPPLPLPLINPTDYKDLFKGL
jgi:transcriptional regulator with XRE-family HTH domain